MGDRAYLHHMVQPNCTRLSFALPGMDVASGKPPSEFRLFSIGAMSTSKGDFLVDDESALLCMAAFADHGNRLTIDYEHQALSEPPIQAPAAASFVPELRNDGIWATDVHWTPKAAEYLSNKEYLYFSPAFLTDEQNRPTRILNVALTNLPATKNMQPLVAAKQANEAPIMKTVLSALSLKDNASEAEALSAVTRMSGERAQLLTITGKETVAEALGVLDGWKQSAAEVTALKAAAAKSQAERDAADFDSEIEAAKKSSVLAASDDHKRNKTALSYKGKPDAIALLRGFLGALDPLVPGAKPAVQATEEPAAGASPIVVLTAEEKRMAHKMNVPLKALLENKARRLSLKPVITIEDDKDAA